MGPPVVAAALEFMAGEFCVDWANGCARGVLGALGDAPVEGRRARGDC